MNITVFCSARNNNNAKYIEETNNLGKLIANHSHVLVFGGSKCGLMDVLCESTINNGGKAIGVIPNDDSFKKIINPLLSEKIIVDNLASRKTKMNELGDAFIVLPGGLGSMAELFTLLEDNNYLGMNKPIVILNINGFYDHLNNMFNSFIEKGTASKEQFANIKFINNAKEAIDYIENNL